MFASYPLRRFSFTRVGLTYALSDTSISAFSQSSQLLFESLKYTSLAGPSALNGIHSSKVTPTISYSTINNPMNPTTGKSIYYGVSVEGGILGGNTNSVSNSFDFKYYHPVNHRRNVIGFHFLGSFETGYNGTEVAPFSRFYLGGDNDIRGFDYFTISPWAFIPTTTNQVITYTNPTVLNGVGGPTTESLIVPVLQFVATRPGGDTEAVTNLEYFIPIAGPVTIGLFDDVGFNGVAQGSQLQLSSEAVGLLQKEFPNPDFPNTTIGSRLSVVSGTSFDPRMSTGIEIIVHLPIINAPFRFYYAYNPLRLTETITQPAGAYYLTQQQKNSLPPGVLQGQVVPELQNIITQQTYRIPAGIFEPSSTFRFSVSRTF